MPVRLNGLMSSRHLRRVHGGLDELVTVANDGNEDTCSDDGAGVDDVKAISFDLLLEGDEDEYSEEEQDESNQRKQINDDLKELAKDEEVQRKKPSKAKAVDEDLE